MKKSSLSVHSENILPIIKKWLYSDKEIFLRELVSNACDALNKLQILRGNEERDLKIEIAIDRENKRITISDNGVGMSAEEVEKYIAQIAFSGAEEFVQKYQSQTEKDPIIGHFGLGFYSAYMVAEKVDIETLSYLPEASPVFWSCDGSSNYEIGQGNRKERGTSIVLHLEKESAEYADEFKLKELLQKFCRFLPFPIFLEGKPLGNKAPLWLKSPSECTDKEYLDFHRSLFPMDPDPIFWIHLNVDYPFHLQGILYFPKIDRRFDVDGRAIQLFCNRVFVSDNCRDILPDYLTMLHGAIDSPDIPLNVSRSYLQLDKQVRQLSAHISKKVSDRLVSLYTSDKESFISAWPDIEAIVKLGLLQDEKFYERIQEVLIWKNSEEQWTTAADYLKRNPKGKVFYALQDRAASLSSVYREKKIEFLYTNPGIDLSVISFLEGKLSCKFQRIDSAVEETLLDSSREKTLLDADGKTESSRIAEFVRRSLSSTEVEVEAKSLAADHLPGLVLLDEQERRFRDYMALVRGKAHPLSKKKTFIVNTNNKLVQTIGRLQSKQPEIAQELARHLFDLSLMAQKELEPKDVEGAHRRQTEILEKLASLLA